MSLKTVLASVAALGAVLVISMPSAVCAETKCTKDTSCAGMACKPDNQKHEGNKIWEKLGLSADQKKQLADLRKDHAGPKQNFEQMKDIRNKIAEEIKKDNPDNAVLGTLESQLGDLAKQAAQHRVDFLLGVKKIITKDQFNKFIDMEKAERDEGPHGPRDHDDHDGHDRR